MPRNFGGKLIDGKVEKKKKKIVKKKKKVVHQIKVEFEDIS
jgi:hypothetical protein